MEKLLNLLNEYEEKRIKKINAEGKLRVKLSFKPYTEESLTNKAYRSCWLEICSKYYGFIEWLVREDKIELPTKISELTDLEGITNYVLKHLSIQYNPIEFLVSILK